MGELHPDLMVAPRKKLDLERIFREFPVMKHRLLSVFIHARHIGPAVLHKVIRKSILLLRNRAVHRCPVKLFHPAVRKLLRKAGRSRLRFRKNQNTGNRLVQTVDDMKLRLSAVFGVASISGLSCIFRLGAALPLLRKISQKEALKIRLRRPAALYGEACFFKHHQNIRILIQNFHVSTAFPSCCFPSYFSAAGFPSFCPAVGLSSSSSADCFLSRFSAAVCSFPA